MVAPAWGEIWWAEAPHLHPRPYLVLTRDAAIPVLAQVLVAPVTTNVRSIPTELPLDPREGVLTACAASMDNITTLPKVHLVRRMGAVDASRKREICRALAAAVDC